MEDNFLMVSNYNADLSWILEYTDNYIVYDRSDSKIYTEMLDQSKVITVPNIGWDIYDKLTFIINNYDALPETMILTKGNIFKYISKHELDAVCKNKVFTPLHSQFHRPTMPTAYYSPDGMYHERNNSWYLDVFPAKFFKSYNEFIQPYVTSIPEYLTFAPGSNYLVPRENIRFYPKEFYQKLRTYVDYSPHPGEAQILERVLYTMWSGGLNLNNPHPAPLPSRIRTVLRKVFRAIKKRLPMGGIKRLISLLQKVKTKLFSFLPEPGADTTAFDIKEVALYRESIKLYDVFTFFNEFDLLEMRLNILDPYVDYFIIVESTETFSGLSKPLYYAENKDRFKQWHHKIIHHVIDDTPIDRADLEKRFHPNTDILERQIIEDALTSDNVPENQIHWLKEFYQKENIKKALNGLRDNDICFVGDVDEIWNPDVLIDYRRNDIFKLKQKVYAYYLNNRSSEPWAGTLITKYINIKRNCLNHLRTKSKTRYTYINDGGWHFTNQGGANQIRKKLESYGHQEFNNNTIKSQIEQHMRDNKDFVGRNFTFWTDETELPQYLIENKEKYSSFFKH